MAFSMAHASRSRDGVTRDAATDAALGTAACSRSSCGHFVQVSAFPETVRYACGSVSGKLQATHVTKLPPSRVRGVHAHPPAPVYVYVFFKHKTQRLAALRPMVMMMMMPERRATRPASSRRASRQAPYEHEQAEVFP
jgi:hypothetical protein